MNISKNRTDAYKGLCAIAILLHHIETSTKAIGGLFFVFVPIGYIMTGLFFFFSGYGLYVSFSKKENYLKGYLKKRMPKLYLPFFAVCVITTLSVIFVTHEKEKYSPMVLFTLGLRLFDFANSWFVWAIIIWSLAFYFLFRFVKNQKLNLIIMLSSSIAFSVVCLIINADRYLYSSVIAFPIGIAFSMYSEKLSKLLKRKILAFIISAVVFLAFFAGAFVLNLDDNRYILFVFQTVALTAFIFMMTVIINNVRLECKLTLFLGSISYYVYLYHGLIMHVISRLNVTDNNYIFTALTLVITIAVSFASQKIQQLITKRR